MFPFRVYLSKPVFRVWRRVKTGYPVFSGFGKSLGKYRERLWLMFHFQILLFQTLLRTFKVGLQIFLHFVSHLQSSCCTKILAFFSKLAILWHFWKPVLLCIKTGFLVLQKLVKKPVFLFRVKPGWKHYFMQSVTLIALSNGY